ncbi:MAG: redoxin domain-containing protein [Hyphomonadaceae bacterium]|nr:MAG: redoxin domain-containing protein [Hyphomonadaceae bacterium]KAF0187074.1 MAG: redoxin domain-containing protein [Hyphomonadaceae bacterium]
MTQNMTNSNQNPQKAKNLFRFSIAMCLLLVLILLAGYFALSLNTQSHKLERFRTGGLAALEILNKAPQQPQQVFFDAQKKEITLADFRGNILVVNIWATWCGPCIEEMPSLANLRAEYKDKPIEIIAISVDRADFAPNAKQKLEELSGGKLAFYHDPMMRIAFPIRAKGFPTTVIYDAQGVEIARVSGAANWDSPEARHLMDALMPSN